MPTMWPREERPWRPAEHAFDRCMDCKKEIEPPRLRLGAIKCAECA